jgi:hypothetical protein
MPHWDVYEGIYRLGMGKRAVLMEHNGNHVNDLSLSFEIYRLNGDNRYPYWV